MMTSFLRIGFNTAPAVVVRTNVFLLITTLLLLIAKNKTNGTFIESSSCSGISRRMVISLQQQDVLQHPYGKRLYYRSEYDDGNDDNAAAAAKEQQSLRRSSAAAVAAATTTTTTIVEEDVKTAVAVAAAARATTTKTKRTTATTTTTTTTSGMSMIPQAKNLQEYHTQVYEEHDRLVVVRFFSPFCKACNAIKPRFHRFLMKYPTVKFIDVPVTSDSAELHETLGIETLPYGKIYYPGYGLAESTQINTNVIRFFDKIIKSYVKGSCPLSDNTVTDVVTTREDDDNDTRRCFFESPYPLAMVGSTAATTTTAAAATTIDNKSSRLLLSTGTSHGI